VLTVVIYIAIIDVGIPVAYIFPQTYLASSKINMMFKRMFTVRYLIHIPKLQLIFISRILRL